MSELEQARAFMRGFQPALDQQVRQRLQLKRPDHNPQDTYELDDIYQAAAFVLMGTSLTTPQDSSLAPMPLATAQTSTDIKLEAILSAIQAMLKTNAEPQTSGSRPRGIGQRLGPDATSQCNFCGVPGHFIRECEIVAEYGRLGKCKRSPEGKVVLPSGAMVPREITGAWLRDRIDEYHRRNPGQMGAAQMLFEMTTQVCEAPSQPDGSKSVRFADQCPETGQPGVYALRRQYIPRTRTTNKSRPAQDSAPQAQQGEQNNTTNVANPSQLQRDQPPHLTQQPPQGATTGSIGEVVQDVHPYTGAPDAINGAATDAARTAQRPPYPRKSDQAYTTTAKIFDEKVARTVYDRVMDTQVTVSQRELLSLSPELRTQVADVTIRRRITRDATQAMIEEIDSEEPKPDRSAAQAAHMPAAFSAATRIPPADATIIADPYEAFLKSHPMGAQYSQDTIEVAAESNSLRAILPVVDNQEKVEAILDPGCQIVAMSEEVCNALALPYDPTIRLNMVSANGGVNQSLGLARNVPFLVGEITLYLQVHILRSPAYDILLGRPFDILTQSVVRNYRDENQTITILDPNTSKKATVPTIQRGSYRFAERHKTIPKSQPQVLGF